MTSKSKAEQAVERDVKGRFRPGSTGNRRGRPTGAAARILLDLRDWAKSEALPLMKQAALDGDMDMLKTLVMLALPKQKPVSLPLSLPGKPEEILEAMADGEVDPSTAQEALGAHLTAARVKELSEIEARLAALERAVQEKDGQK